MNKVELVDALSKKTGLNKAQAEKAFDSVFEVVADALKDGEKVVVTGFGTFEVKGRKARQGHDPRTKAPISIPALKAATFKPGKLLKDKVR